MYDAGEAAIERLRAEYKTWPTVPGEKTLEKIEELIMDAYRGGYNDGYSEGSPWG